MRMGYEEWCVFAMVKVEGLVTCSLSRLSLTSPSISLSEREGQQVTSFQGLEGYEPPGAHSPCAQVMRNLGATKPW